MLVDTHAHVSDEKFDPDRAEALERAQAAGVTQVVEIGESPESWEPALSLAEQHDAVVCALGYHPHYADKATKQEWEKWEMLLSHQKVRAVGEIGLDYFKNPVPAETQKAVFERALGLARDYSKPVVVHSREAHRDMLAVLKKYFSNAARDSGVLHCFQGSWEWAQEILNLGFCLGFDGPITYPKAQELREVLAKIPEDRILLETDCPYLPPQAYRGQRNEPAYLKLVAEEAAKVRNISIEALGRVTTENAKRLFHL